MKLKIVLPLAAVVFGLAVLFFTSKALAEDSPSPEPTESPKTFFRFFNNHSSEPSESPEPSETPRVRGLDRLEGNRLNFCVKHEDEINTRLGSLGDLVSNMLGKFDAIATRVKSFYTTKVAPTHPISNYPALVADIATNRAAAVTALTNAQNDLTGFTCTADNPKGQIRLFRTDMQAVKKALHDYRTSIKNLIVAVKTAIGENGSPEPSASPEATVTTIPSATPAATPTATP